MYDSITLLGGIFGTSFIIAFSGAMMPGPLLAVTVQEAPVRGFIAGPLIVAGHGILELFLVALLLFGLGSFLQRDIVFGIIGALGALVMFWMAYGMFRSVPTMRLADAGGAKSGMNPVMAGIVMSLANPYWSIWWATIGLGYITYSMTYRAAGVVSFYAGHILADLLWYSFISLGISRGRKFISDRVYRYMIGACALALVFFACWFGFVGVKKISAAM